MIPSLPICLDVFAGPLDLLLHLIRRNELDIYDIPISELTTQYIAYLECMKTLDLDVAGEFMVMAATLILIKSRMLLPDEKSDEDTDWPMVDDPREELVRQLLEYRHIKDAAAELAVMEEDQSFIVPRDAVYFAELGAVPDVQVEDVDLMDLLSALSDVMQRIQQQDMHVAFEETVTVAQQMDWLRQQVHAGREQAFIPLLSSLHSMAEVVCTFLALLELIRMHWIRVIQKSSCGVILLWRDRKEWHERE